jgi:hypothetical protein
MFPSEPLRPLRVTVSNGLGSYATNQLSRQLTCSTRSMHHKKKASKASSRTNTDAAGPRVSQHDSVPQDLMQWRCVEYNQSHDMLGVRLQLVEYRNLSDRGYPQGAGDVFVSRT